MIGRRAAVGLSLLCALVFCAFAAQSASAKGTTLFTCIPGGSKDFNDSHCDTPKAGGAFGHAEIKANQKVSVATDGEQTKNETKESTPAIFSNENAEVSCGRIRGTSTQTNEEIGGVMQNVGTAITIRYFDCKVLKPEKCAVSEIIFKGTSITVENLGAGKNEMGVEYKPEAGKPFVEVTFEGAECALGGETFKVLGTLIATGARGSSEATTSSGATVISTKAMSEETLSLDPVNPVSLQSTLTMFGNGPPGTFTTSGNGTTTFSCVEGGTKDFGDAHCDTPKAGGAFGHNEIKLGVATGVETLNEGTKNATKEWTPAILKATIGGVLLEVSCARVFGGAVATNKELAGTMQNEGTGVNIRFFNCAVLKPLKCTTTEFAFKGTSITVVNLGVGKNEMGVEYKPEAGKPFTEIALEGAECPLKGKPLKVEGTLIGTGSRGSTTATSSTGATLQFTKAMSEETLKVGGVKVSLESTLTMSVAEPPLALTTTEK